MRNARVEEPRAWSDVTRQTRATRGTRRLNPRMTPRGKDRRGASKGASGTERMIHARTPTRERDLRENGDTRATRAAVPLQLNHSKPPPLVEFPPLALHAAPNPPVDPLRRPLTTLSLSLSLSLPSLLFSFHLIARRSFFSLPFTVPRFLSFSIVTLISVILVVLLFAGSFVRSFILSSVPLVSSFAFSLRSAKSTSFPTLVSTIHPQVNIEDSFFGRKVVGITDYPTANTISIGDVWSKRGRLFWAH